jgi:hypothetical protein
MSFIALMLVLLDYATIPNHELDFFFFDVWQWQLLWFCGVHDHDVFHDHLALGPPPHCDALHDRPILALFLNHDVIYDHLVLGTLPDHEALHHCLGFGPLLHHNGMMFFVITLVLVFFLML